MELYRFTFGYYSRGTGKDRVEFKKGDVIRPTEGEYRRFGHKLEKAPDAKEETGRPAPVITTPPAFGPPPGQPQAPQATESRRDGEQTPDTRKRMPQAPEAATTADSAPDKTQGGRRKS